MAVIFGLPLVKFGGLVVRTLTKPLAKVVKSRSKVHPRLNAVCHSLGQQQHRLTIKFHMGFRGIEKYSIKDLPADKAVENGADLIGELMIFSVAVAVASFEYTRSSAKSKETERKQEELKLKAERVRLNWNLVHTNEVHGLTLVLLFAGCCYLQELEERFENLEVKVIWLEGKLAELGHIVEHDLDHRIEDAVRSSAVEQVHDDIHHLENKQRRDRQHTENTSAMEPNATSPSMVSSLWTATCNAMTGVFR
ncbi:putative coiled-coil protein, partial [Globisporangium splendens]